MKLILHVLIQATQTEIRFFEKFPIEVMNTFRFGELCVQSRVLEDFRESQRTWNIIERFSKYLRAVERSGARGI